MVMTVDWEAGGMRFTGINSEPEFKFDEAVSFLINCKDQDEVDYFWSRLTADGGQESQCCWLKDKFGLSWQVVPTVLNELISGPDPAGSKRAREALFKMQKPDIQKLQDAYDGK